MGDGRWEITCQSRLEPISLASYPYPTDPVVIGPGSLSQISHLPSPISLTATTIQKSPPSPGHTPRRPPPATTGSATDGQTRSNQPPRPGCTTSSRSSRQCGTPSSSPPPHGANAR